MNGRQERVARVHRHLRATGAEFDSRELTANTSTARLAAQALGCSVGEIAKSIVFRRRRDDRPIVAVLRGDDRVDANKLSAAVGDEIAKADAAYVKENCGFEIGGVAPVACATAATTVMDSRLRDFSKIWAAAGSAHAVFGIAPDDLARAAAALVADIAERAE